MTKKEKGLMVQAKVVDIEGQSFVLQFDVTDEELDVGDTVTVTIVRSEA
jgi:hypothetical protein